MKKYHLLAIDKTKYAPNLVWWGPNDCGYTQNIKEAGIYSEERINSKRFYYDNEECVPVPVEEIQNLDCFYAARNDSSNLTRLGALEKYLNCK